jgi:transposase
VPKIAPYPEEFRREAVRLLERGDRSISQLAADLGVSRETLRSWRKQAELDASVRIDGLTSGERDELRRLRRENRVLREEREVLRKAAAFFASESEGTRK